MDLVLNIRVIVFFAIIMMSACSEGDSPLAPTSGDGDVKFQSKSVDSDPEQNSSEATASTSQADVAEKQEFDGQEHLTCKFRDDQSSAGGGAVAFRCDVKNSPAKVVWQQAQLDLDGKREAVSFTKIADTEAIQIAIPLEKYKLKKVRAIASFFDGSRARREQSAVFLVWEANEIVMSPAVRNFGNVLQNTRQAYTVTISMTKGEEVETTMWVGTVVGGNAAHMSGVGSCWDRATLKEDGTATMKMSPGDSCDIEVHIPSVQTDVTGNFSLSYLTNVRDKDSSAFVNSAFTLVCFLKLGGKSSIKCNY